MPDSRIRETNVTTERRSELLARALSLAPDGTLLERLCAASPSLLGTTSAMIATMSDREGGGVVASAGESARTAFEVEFALGEGPCHEAFRRSTDVLVPDLGRDGAAWPLYSERAVAAGSGAVFAFPARVGAIRVGVLSTHRSRPGPLDDTQLIEARLLADVATMLLLDELTGGPWEGSPVELVASWPGRAVVHQATGMAAVQLGVDLATALARLRGHAFATDTDLDVVARDVVARRLRLEL